MTDVSIGNSTKALNLGGSNIAVTKETGSHRFKNAVIRHQENDQHKCGSENPITQPPKAILKEIKSLLIQLRNLVDQLLSSVAHPGCAPVEPWLPECGCPIDPVHPTPTLPTTHLSPAQQNEAGNPFIRIGPSGYDGNGDEMAGADRPNARAISNAVSAQNGERTFASNGASALLWSWGQFVDHDVNLSKEGHEAANINVPIGDPLFDPQHTGTQSINFNRSDFIIGPDGKRQQINEQTPFVDASMVYGAEEATTNLLRSHQGGRMRVSAGDHLPVGPDGKIQAGDKRAGEQPGLTALHTLFVREHNRMADHISAQNPHWSDNQVFDAARRFVTMEIQAITYNEFLPTLLGDYAPSDLEYVAGTDGRMSNEFATAGYRLGHTMVNETVTVRNADGTTRDIPLRELFFSPNFLADNGVGSVLGGMAGQTAEAVDPMVVDSLRNALFGPPGSGGLDLAALNIQRGRDHGLPSYNDMRESMGLPRIESFSDPIFQGEFGARMASIYDSPDDIDLWVGALAEDQIGNSMLGQTMTYIVAGQFAATAAADPNFFTNHATSSEMAWLGTLTLSDIIRWNSTNSAIDDTAFIATDNQNYYGW